MSISERGKVNWQENRYGLAAKNRQAVKPVPETVTSSPTGPNLERLLYGIRFF
jgi:hypothetical protein